jgi:hypothetical protein
VTITATQLATQYASSSTTISKAVPAISSAARVIAVVGSGSNSPTCRVVTGITGYGATWTRRSQNQYPSTLGQMVEVWYCDVTSAGGSTFTATFDAIYDDASFVVFKLESSTLSAITWDTDSSLPKMIQASPSAAISTASATPYVMLAYGNCDNATHANTPAPSWMTDFIGQQSNSGAVNWENLDVYGGKPGAALSATTVGFTGWSGATPSVYTVTIDALTDAGSGGAVSVTDASAADVWTVANAGTVSGAVPPPPPPFAVGVTAPVAVAAGVGPVLVTPHSGADAPPEWGWYLLQSSGAPIGSLTSATARKLSFYLDGAATASFTMPSDHPETAAIVELGTDVLVTRNGRPFFRGRIGGSADTLNASSDTVNFTAVDYRGMLDHRILWSTSTLDFVQADQAAIAWQLIAESQALPGGNWGLTRGAGASTGILRDRHYQAGSVLSQMLTELGNVISGFDWEVDPNLAFNIYYPQRGRSGLILTYGREITQVTTSLNPQSYANAVRFNGATTTIPVELTGSFPAGIGRWDITQGDPNLILQTTVNDRAAYMLATDSQIIPAFNLTLADGMWDLTQVWLGDSVRLIVQAGRLNVDQTRRIIQVDVTLDDNGGESFVLAHGNAPGRLSDRLNDISKAIAALDLGPAITAALAVPPLPPDGAGSLPVQDLGTGQVYVPDLSGGGANWMQAEQAVHVRQYNNLGGTVNTGENAYGWNVTEYDPQKIVQLGLSGWQIPVDGYYLFSMRWEVSMPGGGNVEMRLYHNGRPNVAAMGNSLRDGTDVTLKQTPGYLTTALHCAAGDLLQVFYTNASSTSGMTFVGSRERNYVSLDLFASDGAGGAGNVVGGTPGAGGKVRSFVSASTAIVQSDFASGYTSTITVAAPANLSAGNALICVLWGEVNSGSFTGPGGWTLQAQGWPGTGIIGGFGVLTHTVGTSEPASYTFGFSAPVRSPCAAVLQYTGGIISVTGAMLGGGTGAFDTAPYAPAQSIGLNNTVVLAFFGSYEGVAFAQPDIMNTRATQLDAIGSSSLYVFDQIAVNGTYGPYTSHTIPTQWCAGSLQFE